jgi:beta-galactosidase
MTRSLYTVVGRFLLCVWLLPFATATTFAQTSPQASPGNVPSLLLGAAWYPEQWPESRWNADLDLMERAHLHVVRVGEFAWTALEPNEDKYDLDWLERAVNLAGRHGIHVILGTPSGAPPVWMAKKYPDILTTGPDGVLYHGDTRNRGNWNSARYQGFVREIDERHRLADR